MSRLLLLDGHSLAYRAFFALPVENFSTTTGQPTNAVYGFTSMLINVLRDEQPTHVAVAFDVSRKTFRIEEYAEYKAGRNATPTSSRARSPCVQEVLDALRIPSRRGRGLRGRRRDRHADHPGRSAQGMDVLICSGDRDALQLVPDQRHGALPRQGRLRAGPDDARRRSGEVRRAAGALQRPRGPRGRVVATTCPACPASGPKTAAKWIDEYGDLTGVVAHVDQIKGKAGESLREHLDGVLRNRRLNALVCDVR